jgi:hypothetical protein
MKGGFTMAKNPFDLEVKVDKVNTPKLELYTSSCYSSSCYSSDCYTGQHMCGYTHTSSC